MTVICLLPGYPHVTFHVAGCDSRGMYVVDPVWRDLDIEGSVPTLADAHYFALEILAHHPTVDHVKISESIRDAPGMGWRRGKGVDTVNRRDVPDDVLVAMPPDPRAVP